MPHPSQISMTLLTSAPRQKLLYIIRHQMEVPSFSHKEHGPDLFLFSAERNFDHYQGNSYSISNNKTRGQCFASVHTGTSHHHESQVDGPISCLKTISFLVDPKRRYIEFGMGWYHIS